jgi:hypothetical protein
MAMTRNAAKKRPAGWVALFTAALLAPATLLAQQPVGTPPPPRTPTAPLVAPPPATPPPTRWYGWETLLAGAFLQVGPVLLSPDDAEALLGVGAVLVPLGTLTIHIIHDDHVKGYIGLVGGYAFSVAGALVGAKVNCSGNDRQGCTADGAVYGFVLGGGVGLMLDAFTLAWGGPPFPPKPPATPPILPLVTPRRGGLTLGVGGVF